MFTFNNCLNFAVFIDFQYSLWTEDDFINILKVYVSGVDWVLSRYPELS